MRFEDTEVPSFERAVQIAEASLENRHQHVRCPHLQELLPDELNLDLVETPDGLKLAHPVHNLHVLSQEITEDPMYGDEHERMIAVNTPGLAESWHPHLGYLSGKNRKTAEAPSETAGVATSASRLSNLTTESNEQSASTASETASIDKPTDVKSSENANETGADASSFEQECHYSKLSNQEEQIRAVRKAFLAKRAVATRKIKRRKIPEKETKWKPTSNVIGKLDDKEYKKYQQQAETANLRMLTILENFRHVCSLFASSKQGQQQVAFSSFHETHQGSSSSCRDCSISEQGALLHCLECSYVGCAPSSYSHGSDEHSLFHSVRKNHTFAVSGSPHRPIYCFKCGDFVYHEVFEYEMARMDIEKHLPWLAWPSHALFRSFNAFNFMRIQDQGIFWKGLTASYPSLRSSKCVEGSILSFYRFCLLNGKVDLIPPQKRPLVESDLYVKLQELDGASSCIPFPVGFYNLGNTCYQSAVVQCLTHCSAFQSYFLRESRHVCSFCQSLRKKPLVATSGESDIVSSEEKKGDVDTVDVCLACEIDRLLIQYYERSRGIALDSVLDQLSISGDSRSLIVESVVDKESKAMRGKPMILSDLLAATWRTKSMEHLRGYKQQDAHEFLHGFLETIGKESLAFLRTIRDDMVHSKPEDDVSNLFKGYMRSVLICQKCGGKRVQKESFTSLSVPLSGGKNKESSLQQCLEHFSSTELLADPVSCPTCGIRTATKKQQVIAKLPRVLCVHLKRFDALKNQKIETFVSFPAKGLNMGAFLPHFAEDPVFPVYSTDVPSPEYPILEYNLFGTVVHFGSINSGHYTANVKIHDKWYHTNDAYVCDSSEELVLRENAYLLFYERVQ